MEWLYKSVSFLYTQIQEPFQHIIDYQPIDNFGTQSAQISAKPSESNFIIT